MQISIVGEDVDLALEVAHRLEDLRQID